MQEFTVVFEERNGKLGFKIPDLILKEHELQKGSLVRYRFWRDSDGNPIGTIQFLKK